MRPLEIVRTAAKRVGAAFATVVERSRARSGFACGDCERWERCGLSPDETCIFKLTELQRRRDRGAPSRYLSSRYLLQRW